MLDIQYYLCLVCHLSYFYFIVILNIFVTLFNHFNSCLISQKPILLSMNLIYEKRDNENQTIMTLMFSKSRKTIRNWRILYNHMLLGIMKHLLYEYFGNVMIYSP